jgi:predicted acyltransferase
VKDQSLLTSVLRIRDDFDARTGNGDLKPRDRLVSLDALRGFDMFWITGGDLMLRSLPKIYDCRATRFLAGQMEHCEWAGFHFYDLIFPLFVFIVGVSIVFSVSGTIERVGRGAVVKRVMVRSLILFLLGVFYMGGVANGFKSVYLAGVLHRIAVAYFFTGLLFCFCRTRTLVLLCAGLLAGYWSLLTFVPVPGVGAPTLAEPGKNLAHYIDQLYLPGQKFEGTLLSTMAAVANCLLGVFAGLLLRNEKVEAQKKAYWLMGAGLASLAAGLAWSLEFPIIKLLWTSSYVLVTCGCSAILLAIFFQVMELWRFQRWAQPFIWMGMNAITIYIIANVVNFNRLAARLVGGDIKASLGVWGDFTQAAVGTALAFAAVRFLYRRRIFLRL